MRTRSLEMALGLREDQELFWRVMTWPTGVDAFLTQADPATKAAFERTFRSSSNFDRTERMGVYAEAYFWRLFEVLRDGYPALAFAMGEVDFRNLITDYVLECPPEAPALRKLGDRLVDFVDAHRTSEGRPWLVEVARLDYWRYALLDSPNHPVVTRSQLAAYSIDQWPGLRFKPGPLRLLRSHYDVPAVWLQSREEGTSPSEPRPPPGDPESEFFQLVWRKGFAVVHRSLTAAEAGALESMERGSSFFEITAHAELDDGGRADPSQVVGWLQDWLDAGLIAEVVSEA